MYIILVSSIESTNYVCHAIFILKRLYSTQELPLIFNKNHNNHLIEKESNCKTTSEFETQPRKFKYEKKYIVTKSLIS